MRHLLLSLCLTACAARQTPKPPPADAKSQAACDARAIHDTDLWWDCYTTEEMTRCLAEGWCSKNTTACSEW